MIPTGMSEVKASTGALPLSVFEDRGAPLVSPAAINDRAADFASSPPFGRPSCKLEPVRNAREAQRKHKRKQPEGNTVLDSSLGSVMTLRSHQAQGDSESGLHIAAGLNEPLIPDLTMPPSPRSMEILGRSRGLRRARLAPKQQQKSSLQPVTTHQQPQVAQMSSPRAHIPSALASQPVGSNWWAAGQPMEHPGALPAGWQHHGGWQGAAEQLLPQGHHNSPHWLAHPAKKHAISHPAFVEGSGVASAGPRHGRALKRQHTSQHAPPAEAQPCLPRAAQSTPHRAQDMPAQHLVGEALAHAAPACWAGRLSPLRQELAYQAGAPSAEAAQFGERHSSMEPATGPTRLQQSWPAPGGGSGACAPPPKKQRDEQRGKLTGKGKQKQQTAQPAVPVDEPQRSVRLFLDDLHAAFTRIGPCEAQSVMTIHISIYPELQSDLENSIIADADMCCYARSLSHCRVAALHGPPAALQGGLAQLHREVGRFAQLAAPTVVRSTP